MKVEILGTRANIKLEHPRHRKYTGILIDDKILLDVGEEEYMRRNPEYIFVTHLHSDHAAFLHAEVLTGSRLKEVYAPETHPGMTRIVVPPVNEPIPVYDYQITPVSAHHSARVKSFAYCVEKNAKRIFFTGDVSTVDPNWKHFGNFDLVIIDGSHFRQGGHIQIDKKSGQQFGHTGIPDQVEFFRKITRHIVVIHLGSWFMREPEKGELQIRSLSEDKLIVEPADDGQVFII